MSFIVNPYVFSSGFTVPGDPGGPSPADLSNFQLWLKGNNTQFNGVVDDTEISGTWDDSSGNARNVSAVAAGTPSTYPKFKQLGGPNSYPAIRMVTATGSRPGGWFTVPNFLTGYTSGDIFCIVKLDADPPSTTSANAPAAGDWGTAGDSYYPFTNDGNIYDDFGSSARKDNIAAGSLAQWRVYEVRTALAAWSNYLDGTQLHSTAVNTVAWSTAPFIGHTATNSKYLEGLIAEIIFYSSVLSDSDRWNTVHTYLNNKYGFSLPTS
jgi:hypothetical protein